MTDYTPESAAPAGVNDTTRNLDQHVIKYTLVNNIDAAPKWPAAQNMPEAASCNHKHGCGCFSGGLLGRAIREAQQNELPLKQKPVSAPPVVTEKAAANLEAMLDSILKRDNHAEETGNAVTPVEYTSPKLSPVIPEAQKKQTTSCCELQGACGTNVCPIERMAASLQIDTTKVLSRDEYNRRKALQPAKKTP